METALGILLLLVSIAGAAVVLAAFVWAARKDGQQDRALQRRLGIRRRTRMGRRPIDVCRHTAAIGR